MSKKSYYKTMLSPWRRFLKAAPAVAKADDIMSEALAERLTILRAKLRKLGMASGPVEIRAMIAADEASRKEAIQ